MQYACGINSASMWRSLRIESTTKIYESSALLALRLENPDTIRIVLREPMDALPEDLEAILDEADKCFIEDPFDLLRLKNEALFSRERLPAMYRDPSELGEDFDNGFEVHSAISREELSGAERVIVDGYPIPSRQPFMAGRLLPASLLHQKSFQIWFAKRGGDAVSACFTHDDGTNVGFYMVATLPEARSKGAARSLLRAVINTFHDRPLVLTSTDASRPIYETFGFKGMNKGTLIARRRRSLH